jgi:ribonuclease Y
MDLVATLITILFGILAGVACGLGIFTYKQGKATVKLALEREQVSRLLEEARTQQRELVLQAKDETLKLRQEAENEIKERRTELQQRELRMQQKEEGLEHKQAIFEERERTLLHKERELELLKLQAEELRHRQAHELERIANMTEEQARDMLVIKMEDEARHYASARVRKIEEEAREKGEEKARKILAVAMSRIASDFVSEAVVSTIALPSDEMKGRIIGREGRNIRAFEQATGVDLIVDDTPEAVTLSCFDPVRREVAKRALSKLILDGRIHQARIEETVSKARLEVEQQIREDGERAAFDAGVQGIHPEILTLLGKLRYRTSYGQNQLSHAVEVSHIAGIIAAEVGANVHVSKAGALLHDIGKVMDQEIEGPHAIIGGQAIRRLMKNEAIAHAVAAHHGEEDPQTVEAWVVMTADALSGGRPGARREQVETYIRRLEALEELAMSVEGVERCFAIQAGRELRILVRPEVVDDITALRMARDLSKQIEESIQYPGQIKVTVIRETRAVDYAK